uniref:Programmed cell death 1 n=1 Tax=Ursus americanus TaxID=9643 RepID=A0A452QX29_URSAM
MGAPRAPWPLVWAVLQLGWWPGWLLGLPDGPWAPFTFSPAPGRGAQGECHLTCSLFPRHPCRALLCQTRYRMSPRNTRDDKNWGRLYRRDRHPPAPTGVPTSRGCPMAGPPQRHRAPGSVTAATYLLRGAIYLPPNTQISESPRAELTVRERSWSPTESPSPPPRITNQLQGLVIGITSVLVGVPLLLLVTWVLAAAFPRAARGKTTDASLLLSLKKEGPSAAPVFTVDYGELDFQWREKTPEPSAPCAPEQTEYATIVFPSRPGSPGRRASAHSPQGPQPLSPEDGPCPWPL